MTWPGSRDSSDRSASPVIPALLAMVMVLFPVAGEAGFRCGSSLVSLGDWPVEVRDRCGEPDYIATYPTAAIPGLGIVQEVEHWYYNRGPQRFIRRLEFRNGSLQREDTLGYGFSGDSPGACTPASLEQGLSEFEVVTRCGEPLSRRTQWRAYSSRNAAGVVQGQALMPVETWLYDFGDRHFRRELTVVNGRVTRVETGNRP
ncbi:MAG: DUF2845 domain-containing protein [Ectothiorhodospiraceae bacterium]|nr:DUF2845 domain-containing protein [Ectothiorhodospiraceae bacterium]